MSETPIILDRVSYPSTGLLSIVGLVVSLGIVYQLLTANVISFGLAIGLYFLTIIAFSVIYSDLWLLDDERDVEEE